MQRKSIEPIVAHVKVRGTKGEVELKVLVDTGSTFSIADHTLHDLIGLEVVPDRKVKVRSICCEVEGVLAVLRELVVEDVYFGPTIVLLTSLSDDVKRTLRMYDLSDMFILGLRDVTGFT